MCTYRVREMLLQPPRCSGDRLRDDIPPSTTEPSIYQSLEVPTTAAPARNRLETTPHPRRYNTSDEYQPIGTYTAQRQEASYDDHDAQQSINEAEPPYEDNGIPSTYHSGTLESPRYYASHDEEPRFAKFMREGRRVAPPTPPYDGRYRRAATMIHTNVQISGVRSAANHSTPMPVERERIDAYRNDVAQKVAPNDGETTTRSQDDHVINTSLSSRKLIVLDSDETIG